MNMMGKRRDRACPCPDTDKGQPQGFTLKVHPDIRPEGLSPREGLSLQYLAIFLIKAYQNTLGFVFPQACRFYPSCSEYSIQAFERHGFFKGGWLSIRRLLRCHPFNPGGYDPVE
jgi:putative membrane protein insertion efficiency factor